MNGAKKRILVIDDQEIFLHAMAAELRLLGYEVKAVLNAIDGIEALLREAFDLVMVDMIMPEIGGLLAINAIRQEHPDIPILAISGYYDKLQDALRGTKVDGILPKPIRLGMLERALRRVLSKKSGANCEGLESRISSGAYRLGREPPRR